MLVPCTRDTWSKARLTRTPASRVPWTRLFSKFPQTSLLRAIILSVSSIFLRTTRREKNIWNENRLFRIALLSNWDPSFWNQIQTFVRKPSLSTWFRFSKRSLLRRTCQYISETSILFCWERALVLLNTLKILVRFQVSKSKTRNTLFCTLYSLVISSYPYSIFYLILDCNPALILANKQSFSSWDLFFLIFQEQIILPNFQRKILQQLHRGAKKLHWIFSRIFSAQLPFPAERQTQRKHLNRLAWSHDPHRLWFLSEVFSRGDKLRNSSFQVYEGVSGDNWRIWLRHVLLLPSAANKCFQHPKTILWWNRSLDSSDETLWPCELPEFWYW